MATQWRGAGLGIIGLDWPAVLAIARLLHMEVDARLFYKLRALEDLELERMHAKDN